MAHFSADQFVCIMYYSTQPYRCPEYAQRDSFYSVPGTPDAWFDGYEESLGGLPSGSMYSYYRPIVDAHLADPSPLSMSSEMTIEGTSGSVSGHIEVTEAFPASTYGIYLVIYEENAARTPNLARGFPVFNEPLTISGVGETQDVSANFTVGDDWNQRNLEAILFVQDMGGTKEILQADRASVEVSLQLIVVGPGEGPTNANIAHGYQPERTDAPDVDIQAYNPDKYGTNVAVGDINGDLAGDILTGPGPGAIFGPQVRGFDYDGDQLPGVNFLAYTINKYGVNVAAGDIDGDGVDEIVTGPGPGIVFGPHVRGWNYNGSAVTPAPGASFLAYTVNKYGVNVACGDIDGDGVEEIVTGPGPGAVFGPHVRGWNYSGSAVTPIPGVSYLAYGTHKFGVNVACGDIDGDGYAEIITGAGPGAVFGPHLRGWNYDGASIGPITQINFFAFSYTQYGVNVGAGDVDFDGIDEILAGAGPGASYEPWVRIYNFDGAGLTMTHDFTAFSSETADFTHGANVAAGIF